MSIAKEIWVADALNILLIYTNMYTYEFYLMQIDLLNFHILMIKYSELQQYYLGHVNICYNQ